MEQSKYEGFAPEVANSHHKLHHYPDLLNSFIIIMQFRYTATNTFKLIFKLVYYTVNTPHSQHTKRLKSMRLVTA